MEWFDSVRAIFNPFLVGLLVSAGVGLIIGLEREFNTHDEPGHLGGIRTFTLVALLGFCAGWIGKTGNPVLLPAVVAGFILLVGVSYFLQAKTGKMGLTTELALILTLLLGIFNAADLMRESVTVVVLVTLLLSLKAQLHGFIRQMTQEELFAFIKFIILALLILPMLPDQPFGPQGLLNLRDMGWIVVLVLSLSFTGYLMLKFGSPDKGILLTAIVGGLFSSTMIAWVFSAKSRERKDLASVYGSGIVLASSIMFIRVMILTLIFDPPVAVALWLPLLLMLLVSLVPTGQVLKKQKSSVGGPHLSPGNPLDIKNAAFFVLLYVGITFFMYGSREWLGTALTYLSGAIAGIADIDSITISTSKWASVSPDSTAQARAIILLAVMSNSIFKLLVSVFSGAKEIRKPVTIGFGLVLLVGVGFLLCWFLG